MTQGDITIMPEVTRRLFKLKKMLAKLSPECRHEVFQAVVEGYCEYCGEVSPIGPFERCQCRNDE